jgi:hypothetical protein
MSSWIYTDIHSGTNTVVNRRQNIATESDLWEIAVCKFTSLLERGRPKPVAVKAPTRVRQAQTAAEQ